jgi:hypothetical protein
MGEADMKIEFEARKLTERMHRELYAGPRAVRQCTALLLTIIIIVLMGLVFPPTYDGPLDAEASADIRETVTRHEVYDRGGAETQAPQGAGKNLTPVATTTGMNP